MGPPDPTALERQQALELNNLRGKFCLVGQWPKGIYFQILLLMS